MASVNTSAPLVASGEIEIAAPPEIVWEVLTAIDRWPEWDPDIRWTALDGGLSAGSTFRWKSGPGTITSTIREVEPMRRIVWSGRTFGIHAIHAWRLTPRDGGTAVATEESWDGLVVRIFRRQLRRTLERAVASGLRHLKTEAERRSKG